MKYYYYVFVLLFKFVISRWDVTLDAAQPQDVASQPSMQSFVQVTRAPKHSTQPSQQATQRSRGRAIMRLKLNVRRGRI